MFRNLDIIVCENFTFIYLGLFEQKCENVSSGNISAWVFKFAKNNLPKGVYHVANED